MTELIWDGKYDASGKRVAPLRMRLPFQTVETVNESAQERNLAFDLFSQGRDPLWRNRLIWGDKKYVLPALLDDFAGKVDLIYIDPPFDTGADFSFNANIPLDANGGGDTSFVKEPSIIEQKAYRDIWGSSQNHLDSYLKWFYETVVFLRDLTTQTASIYVHCDYRVNSFIRLILEEVFGRENFQNEITWLRSSSGKTTSKAFPRDTDTIYFFSKSPEFTFNTVFMPLSERTLLMYDRNDDDSRGKYRLYPMQKTASPGPETTYDYVDNLGRTWKCPPKGWRMKFEKMKALENDGRLFFSKQTAHEKAYWNERENEGKQASNLWNDIPNLQGSSLEMVNYPTQKPEALLQRIIQASSNEGDLVLDCFCGSGTTAAVAEKLGRRWITADLGRFAIHTARKRLLGIPNVRPFVVQNLGKYERQVWQAAEFGERAEAAAHAYRAFILDLYAARALTGYTWLHGLKNGRMVHVGSVDAPVSPGDVTNIVSEFARAVGTGADAPKERGVDVLGWDFAFELHEVAKQQAALAGIDVRFVRIPREVLEKKAVEQGDIRFFELAALSVDVQQHGRAVTLTLADFVIPLDDVPEDVQRAITHWSQWVDYWAVDWDNKGDTFHNEWQSYRTRASKDLQKQVAHTYAESAGAPRAEYTIVVKVIDLLGNDTTKALSVVLP